MSQSQMHPLVSRSEAHQDPYPYVYVTDDGTVRELHQAERDYLQTPFYPYDGDRPYVKVDFDSRDGWGNLKGFCLRSVIPGNLPIASAPADDPNPPMSKAEHVEWLRKKMVGFEVVERADGTVEMKRVPKQ
jgi:hypothetical protein